MILPFEEVVDALGRTGQVDRGLQVVQLDDIVGTVDRAADFDRGFRPTSQRLRSRWERIAAAQRRGEAMPPVSLFKVGELYFVRDGHHRVSVAKSQGRDDIDAYVTEVTTRLQLGRDLTVSQLPLKDHERLFRERVPLSADAARADPALGPVGVRLAGRDGRGVGLPDDAGARSLRRPPRSRAALVRARVRAGLARCWPRAG